MYLWDRILNNFKFIMKLKLIIASAAFLFAAVGCSKGQGDNLVVLPSPSRVENAEAKFLRLSINHPREVTLRSTGQDPLKEVKSLLLLFYGNDDQLKVVKEVSGISASDLSNITVKLLPDDYKLVVLANAGTGLRKLVQIGAPLSNLQNGQVLSSSAFWESSTGVSMGNDQGAVSVSKSAFSSSGGLGTSINITLEPMLARILVYGEPSLRAGKTTADKPRYLITNISKSVSILRQMNNLSTGVAEQPKDNSTRSERYAKSPLWSSWLQSLPVNTSDVGAVKSESSTYDLMKNTVHPNIEQFRAELGMNTGMYVKESTIPENAYLKGLTPCVVIAYPYIPQSLNLSSGEGWLSYQGAYYSESEVKEMLNRREDGRAPALMQALRDNGITTSDFANTAGFSKGGVSFYYKGYNYYSVFIRHFVGDGAYGRYGVVRGNEYRIKIVQIEGPGSPTPITYIDNMEKIGELSSSSLLVSLSEITTRDQEVNL